MHPHEALLHRIHNVRKDLGSPFPTSGIFSSRIETQPQERPIFLQTWIVQFHLVRKPTGVTGAWILLEPNEEIGAGATIGIHTRIAFNEGGALIEEAITAAMEAIRKRSIRKTVHVVIQSAILKSQRPQCPELFRDFNSYMWKTTQLKQIAAAAKLIKMSATKRIAPGKYEVSSLPPRLQEWLRAKCISKVSPSWPPYTINIRQSLQKLQDYSYILT